VLLARRVVRPPAAARLLPRASASSVTLLSEFAPAIAAPISARADTLARPAIRGGNTPRVTRNGVVARAGLAGRGPADRAQQYASNAQRLAACGAREKAGRRSAARQRRGECDGRCRRSLASTPARAAMRRVPAEALDLPRHVARQAHPRTSTFSRSNGTRRRPLESCGIDGPLPEFANCAAKWSSSFSGLTGSPPARSKDRFSRRRSRVSAAVPRECRATSSTDMVARGRDRIGRRHCANIIQYGISSTLSSPDCRVPVAPQLKKKHERYGSAPRRHGDPRSTR